jgi:hypothetical protein
MSRIRVVPILIIMAVMSSVLFGGWELYRKFGLVLPLEEQLKADQAVTTVETTVSGQQRGIKITLKPVSDLQQTYEGLEKKVTASFGQQVKIDIADTRNDELKAFYRDIQPTLYGGIQKGDYTQMIEQVGASAQQAGLQSNITMNDRDIFVQLQQGKDHYLYEVIPYHKLTAERLLEVTAQ